MVRVKSFRFKVWSFGFRVKGYRVSRFRHTTPTGERGWRRNEGARDTARSHLPCAKWATRDCYVLSSTLFRLCCWRERGGWCLGGFFVPFQNPRLERRRARGARMRGVEAREFSRAGCKRACLLIPPHACSSSPREAAAATLSRRAGHAEEVNPKP
jgi:hypothetical protein